MRARRRGVGRTKGQRVGKGEDWEEEDDGEEEEDGFIRTKFDACTHLVYAGYIVQLE